ncbi:O-antigen ligase family protein [Phenylobacterium montanum]|uniref:O-antigen ligase family protein n=1 Tax=Phenylobacterium montanum TaxID=2823693 RepID=A0A975FYQ5_9CAUL|nr:O-antigen ligase family protein [Caulobacter sp. S6]QUD87913.1 O-antigen ligase family protein [Caulobacter sp. S6]
MATAIPRAAPQAWLVDNLLCAALTATVFSQFVALGATTPLLAASAATVELTLALIVLAASLGRVSPGYWSRLYPVGLVLLAALAWQAWPLWRGAIPGLQRLPGWRAPLNPDAAGLEALKLAGAIACALSAAILARSRARAIRLTSWLVVGGGAYVILSLWLWRWDPLYVWGIAKGDRTWSFTGSLLSANAAGAAFGMISVLALGLTQSMSRTLDLHAPRLRELLLFGAACFGVVAALAAAALTGSRTSLILTAFMTAALAIVDLTRIQDGTRLPRLIGAAVLGVILLAVALGVGLAPIAAKAGVIEEFGTRAAAYQDYLKAAWAAPWSGYGAGSFAMVNEAILPGARMDERWSFTAAHCAPLQAALESGLPFLALMAGAMLAGLAQVARAWIAHSAASAVGLAALAAGLLAIGCSMVDVALNVPAIAAFCALALGLAWGSAAGIDLPPRQRSAVSGWNPSGVADPAI